jgi:shikimate kinase
VNEPSEDVRLIEICARKVLEHLELEQAYGARVVTESEIPIAVGLSSSSAAANAAILATFSALGEKPKPKIAIDLGIDAAFEAGVTVTGAFDDAAASFFGCGVVTDNSKRRILKKFKLNPELGIVIYVPSTKSYTSQIDVTKIKMFRKLIEIAHDQAMQGNIFGALTLNGLLHSNALGYDPTITLNALRAGALAAGLSGTGPSVVAIVEPRNVNKVRKAWAGKNGRIIVTKPAAEGARVEGSGHGRTART